jgi:predicted NBD/HSP70 family sugar kinase
MELEMRDRRPILVPDTINIEAVLSVVGGLKASTRAAVARKLALSRTTVSTIVTKLLALGLIAEKNIQIEGRGRPGIILDLDDSRWKAIGAEYHSGKWSFVATNLKGKILASRTEKVRLANPEAFMESLITGLKDFIGTVPGSILPAVGIGAPGLVDCDRGTIIRADDLGWKQVDVGPAVEKMLGMEALLINRNRASGLAEARFGAGRGVHSLVYIGIGTGISAAFINAGELINGSSFSAGEIGHIIMDTAGPVCGCGKRGCLHVYASGTAMGQRASSLIESGRTSSLTTKALSGTDPATREGGIPVLSGETVCAAAAEGDELALECLSEAARFLGLGVANIINTFNPDKIVLGGPIGLMDSPLVDLVRAQSATWAMSHAFNAVTIERGRLGDYVGALGAACRVLDRKYTFALRGEHKSS